MQVGIHIPIEVNPTAHEDAQYFLEKLVAACCVVQNKVRFTQFISSEHQMAIEGCEQVRIDNTGIGSIINRSHIKLNRALKEYPVNVLLAPMTEMLKVQVPLFLCALNLARWEQASNDDPAPVKPKEVRAWKRYCLQASRIMAPTKYLQRRFLDFFECPLDKMLVNPVGTDTIFQESTRSIAQSPYLILYSDTLARPIMTRVRAALEMITEQYPHQIIIVGPGYSDEPDNWGVRTMRLEQCPPTQMAGLYQHCDAFIYSGLHDGSALRVLEAIHADAPVVAARSGAIEEVAGDMPIYFNPGSTNSIIQAIKKVIDNPETRRESVKKKSRHLLQTHNWETCAWKFLGALNHFEQD